MSPFAKKIMFVVLGFALLVAGGVAKRLLAPRAETEAQRQEKLRQDVRKDVDKALSGFKLCPPSEPNCNVKK